MKTSIILSSVLTLGLLSFQGAWAQNAQSWLTNEQNKIQQDTGAGLINNQQAGYLQNREAQIQAQEQGYLNQNGGTLTPGENAKIGREVHGLNRGLRRDVRRDNPGFNPGYNPAYNPALNQGLNPAFTGWQPMSTPAAGSLPYMPFNQSNAGNWTPAQRQAWEQQHHHHHHQGQWNNGQGYTNWNGTTNGGNPQYWNH